MSDAEVPKPTIVMFGSIILVLPHFRVEVGGG